MGELNYQTAAYTSRYILKKINGKRAETHYEKLDPITGEIYKIQPEYITMSLGRACNNHKEKRDPTCEKCSGGIGWKFYEKYESDFFPRDECPIPGKGVYKSVPTYYEHIYKQKNPDTYEQIKERRRLYKAAHKDEYTPERLATKKKVKQAQLAQLPRK